MRKCTKNERLTRTAENKMKADERTKDMLERYKKNKTEKKFDNI
jgi:hypothetical protein